MFSLVLDNSRKDLHPTPPNLQVLKEMATEWTNPKKHRCKNIIQLPKELQSNQLPEEWQSGQYVTTSNGSARFVANRYSYSGIVQYAPDLNRESLRPSAPPLPIGYY